jgi:hypothetical protein
MKRTLLALLRPIFIVVTLAACVAAQDQLPAKQQARISTTEKFEFGKNGTIQIIDSFGSVHVEGWDQPEIELTVTRASQKKYEAKDLPKRLKDLERIKVVVERVSESSMLVIRTTFPARTPTRMMRGKSNLDLDYKIKVPRTCRLFIKHDIGEVVVSNIDNDIEATNRIGELALHLPEDGKYAVDAKVKIGDVSSAFGPETHRQKLVGARMQNDSPADARRLYLRVGIGDIHVEKLAPRRD